MTEPVVERIAQDLAARLRTITRANGYWGDLSEVLRPRRQTITPQHRQIILRQGNPVQEDGPAGHEQWTQPFILSLIARPPDNDQTPADCHTNRLVADVRQCLAAAPGWTTLAIQWSISGPEPLPEDLGVDGAQLTVNVSYRTLYGDPYHQ